MLQLAIKSKESEMQYLAEGYSFGQERTSPDGFNEKDLKQALRESRSKELVARLLEQQERGSELPRMQAYRAQTCRHQSLLPKTFEYDLATL